MALRIGIEILLKDRRSLVRGARLGAVVNPASILPNLQHTSDALYQEQHFQLVSLLGPQHGARGEKQANMIESDSYRDPETKLPVHSLYGVNRRPTETMLRDIDVLVFDLQDVGTRVYTYIHTMAYCMEACAEYGKPMIVLDRPNPVNGLQVEGNLLEPEFRSFVGRYAIPMRHGMTIGELSRMINEEFEVGCDLTVIPMEGWNRSYWFDETDLPWIMPSPNLPTLDTATVYPGMVLVEGTSLSEGRGTTRPFELLGAPYISGKSLAAALNDRNLPGVLFRPVHFQPTFQKWVGQVCGGVQVHVRNRHDFEPYLTGIVFISTVRELYPEHFSWLPPPYEYEYEKLPIEILTGSRVIPRLIEERARPDEIRESWREDISLFLRRRESYLLYR